MSGQWPVNGQPRTQRSSTRQRLALRSCFSPRKLHFASGSNPNARSQTQDPKPKLPKLRNCESKGMQNTTPKPKSLSHRFQTDPIQNIPTTKSFSDPFAKHSLANISKKSEIRPPKSVHSTFKPDPGSFEVAEQVLPNLLTFSGQFSNIFSPATFSKIFSCQIYQHLFLSMAIYGRQNAGHGWFRPARPLT